MSPKDLRHFLVIYRVREGRADTREYSHGNEDAAMDAYQAAERAHQGDPEVEVVLLSADSREALMATHGRFFDESRRHVDDYLTDRLDELLSERDSLAA